jgi:hypothetical protein
VPPLLDVHPPHESVHNWRDFLLHITTITIGLFIALSLEGMVEWQHHRHLVQDAEASLHTEIAANAKDMQSDLDDLHQQQAALKNDVVLLKYLIAHRKMPVHGNLEVTFHIRGFENVSWKTAQNTGALEYMPYDRAQKYSDIYGTQAALESSEQQAARDAIVSLGPFLNFSDKDPDPTPEQANAMKDHIETLQGQLLLVDSYMQGLSKEYQKFLAANPS